jgi:hypothetical protein
MQIFSYFSKKLQGVYAMGSLSIISILSSDDPLSTEAIEYLFNFHEEDSHVDYKLTLSYREDREWLKITKDFLSFANTEGGYLVFGIENSTYSKKGITDDVANHIAEPNNIIQKINRFIAPPINHIRTKKITRDGKYFVFIYIPPSKDITHVVDKIGAYKNSNHETLTILRPGEIYIRKSGKNSLIDCHTFEELLNRRIHYYSQNLLSNISRVIEAPPNHEVLVFDPRDTEYKNEQARSYRITSAPDAIPVAGLSFTISPSTDEELIASWIALNKQNLKFLPNMSEIYRLYSLRRNLIITQEQKYYLALFSSIYDAPIFFWLQEKKKVEIIDILKIGFGLTLNLQNKISILRISSVLGRAEYRLFLNLFSQQEKPHLWNKTEYPTGGPSSFFHLNLIDHSQSLEDQATMLAQKICTDQDKTPDKETLLALDFKLYAQSDGYQ